MTAIRTNRVQPMINRGMVHTAILAGGFGTRLDAIADQSYNKWAIAKPAAPIGNLRIIEFGIKSLRKAGIEELNLLVCHLPNTIRHVVGDGKIYGENVKVRELLESASDPLDTAGAVGRLVHNEGWANKHPDIIVVPSGDIIHNVDLEEVIDVHLFNREKHGAAATIVVNPVPWNSVERFGTVRLEGMPKRKDCSSDDEFEDKVGAWIIDQQAASAKIVEFREKKPRSVDPGKPEEQRYLEVALSNLNNSSIYIFNASLFKTLLPMFTKKDTEIPLIPSLYQRGPTPFSDWGRHVFRWLTEIAQRDNYPLFAYVMPQNGYWRDAGTGEELRQANMDVLDGRLCAGLKEGEGSFWFRMEKESWHGINTFIHPSAYVSRSLIGDNVIIGEGARIIHSVIGAGTQVGDGVQMWGTVIFPKHRNRQALNVIGKNSQITDCLILGGNLEPETDRRNCMLYDPVGGMAIGSLLGKTQYFAPKT